MQDPFSLPEIPAPPYDGYPDDFPQELKDPNPEAPFRRPVGFGDGFVYGLTGYKRHADAHEKMFGRLIGELSGYLTMAVTQRHPIVNKLGSKLKSLQATKPIVGAKRSLDLWASPKGRAVLQKMGFSPERAAILSRQASNDIGIEMLFQGGKLGVGYGSGTEDAPGSHKAAEMAAFIGLTPLGTLGGDKIGQGLKRLYKKYKSPEDIGRANEEGRVIDPDDTGVAPPETGRPSVDIFSKLRKQELLKHQWQWIKNKADNILHNANVKFPREGAPIPDDTYKAANVEGKEWLRVSEESKQARAKANAQRNTAARIRRESYIGRSSNLRADLNAAVRANKISAEDADAVLREFNLQLNSVSTVDWRFTQAHELVWEPLPDELWGKMDEYVLARTTLGAIQSRRRAMGNAYTPLKSMFDEEQASKIVNDLEIAARRGDMEAGQIKESADSLFGFIRKEITDEYHKLDMIGDLDHARLSKDYLPREFLHIFDKRLGAQTMRDIMARDPDQYIGGVRSIGEGIEELQNLDTRVLLRHALAHAQRETQRQRIAKTLSEITTHDPENALVQMGYKGLDREWVKPEGDHWVPVDLFIKEGADSHKGRIYVHREIAKDIQEGDPHLSLYSARQLRAWSLSTILKKAAVEYNPIFGTLVNPILDGFSQFMYDTARHRSTFFPKWMAQMSEDVGYVWKDAIKGKGLWIDAFARHGGPVRSLISHEAAGRTPGSVEEWLEVGTQQAYKKRNWKGQTAQSLHKFASASTTKSEMLMRLAMFRRSLKNQADKAGFNPEEILQNLDNPEYEEMVRKAVNHAIDYVNFADDGRTVRVIDTWAPFLQAGFNVLRPQARSAVNDPQLYAWKAAQLSGLGAALIMMNKMVAGEEYDKISSHAKANNYIIMTPFESREKGKTRNYYLQFPKDSASAPFVSLAESIVKRMTDGEIPSDELIDSFATYGGVSPVHIPTSKKGWNIVNNRYFTPPLVQAYFAYFANKDIWYNEDVWSPYKNVSPEQEVKATTSRLAQDVGGTLGISPERTERAFGKVFTTNNPFVSFTGWAYKAIATAVSDNPGEEAFLMKDLIETLPKRILKKTPAYDSDVFSIPRKESDRIDAERADNNQTLFKILQGVEDGSKDSSDIRKFLSMQTPDEKTRLEKKLKFWRRTDNLMHFHLLKSVALVPPQERAKVTYQVYRQLPLEQQAAFLNEVRRYPGLVTRDNFWSQFNLLQSQETGRALLLDTPKG